MSSLKALQQITESVDIQGNQVYFKGNRYTLDPQQALMQLTGLLYTECYAKKDAFQNQQTVAPNHPEGSDHAFVEMLSAHNQTQNRLEPNWTITAILPDDRVEIAKGMLQKSVPSSHLSRTHPQAEITVGEKTAVHFAREDRHIQKGFYYAYSREPFASGGQMIRIYWNISSEGAAPLVAALTGLLNHYRVPFIFKCLDHPQVYFRRDGGVLYLESRYIPIVSRLLGSLSETLKPYLQDDVPLCTYRFSAGIGMAENPITDESFGMHRMQIVATSLLESSRQGHNAVMKAGQLAQTFAHYGIDPETPYLNKGSKNIFKNLSS